MENTLPLLPVIAILFFSSLTRASLGFGDALVAMPLLALVIDMTVATPLVALFAPLISLLILARHWQKADLRAALRLIAATWAGIPLGLYFLIHLPENYTKTLLGGVILAYGIYNLLRPRLAVISARPLIAWLVGFIAGILGGAYNTNGPPVVIYGRLRGWPPEDFRATLQGYFLPTGLFIALGHGAAGLWSADVLRLFLYNLPFVLLAIYLGGQINRAIPPGKFDRAVYVALVVMGAMLVVKSWS